MLEYLRSIPASVAVAIISGLIAFIVARWQMGVTLKRDQRIKRTDIALQISQLLLDPAKNRAAARRFAVGMIKIRGSSDDRLEGRVVFLPLNSRITIGRDADNDLVLPADVISRFHCGLVSDVDQVFLEDYCSTNGVVHNGNRLESGANVALKDGDVIEICETRLYFQTVYQSKVMTHL